MQPTCRADGSPSTGELFRAAEQVVGTTAGISRALRNYPHKCASPIVTRKPGSLAALLYLVIEILATGVPVVIALNMSDEAARDGIAIDTARLEAPTGAEVVRTVATRAMRCGRPRGPTGAG